MTRKARHRIILDKPQWSWDAILPERKRQVEDCTAGFKRPFTPNDVARKCRVSWNTAKVYMDQLVREDVLRRERVGSVNVYWRKGRLR